MKVDLAFQNTLLGDILAFLRDFSELNFVLDPSKPEEFRDSMVDELKVKNMSLRGVLETLCALKDLDFDLRYGVLFFTKPMRLWSTDPAVGLPSANEWSRQSVTGGEQEIAGKLRTIRLNMDMSNAPLSAAAEFLREISGVQLKPEALRSEQSINLKVQDLLLSHVLELLSLPHGWDVRIEGRGVVLFELKK
jgi:hypothetical protein